ncbi:hypothetical protein E7681_00230 [Thalassobius vesicularis]|uniref:DUF3887 domain-containing protein n=1 Tax=Thalassobius vesicularis TaxID=1294297 RepID=A0A4S3MF23_9RHOB|nr:hypothetical protein [Thalassobius vesicularis]THD76304.1 hypothetical protein E7681_00230 [Thalassobius vesicularis]
MTRSLRVILLIALPLLTLGSALRAQSMDDPFRPDWMSYSDLQFLQTGLTLQGLYVGLIDGKWGKGSQGALERALGRASGSDIRNRDLLPLLQATRDAIQTDFWQGVTDFPDKVTFLAPMSVVQQDLGSELFTLQSPDQSLKIRLIENDKDKTVEMHKWLIENHKGTKQQLYQKYDKTVLITSGLLGNGKTVYLRSQYARSQTIVTVLVQYDPSEKERGQLVAASISYDRPITLTLDQYGTLARLMSEGTTPVRPSQPAQPGGGISGGGSGGGIGISRPAPGTGTQPAPPAQPGGGSGGGIGIGRPAAPIASGSFTIPPVPMSE